MKRIAIFQLLVISCFNLLAQIRPTQREINNFDSGDVFHSTYWLNAGPPNYIKRYFLSNKISKQDTIQYLVIDTTISYVAPMIWEQKVKQYYLSYTQLDEVPGSKSWMYIHEDTFGLMNCNDTFFSKTLCDFSGHDSGNVSQGSCTTYIFAKGLGLYTLYSSHGGGPGSQQYFKIDYYKKVNKECGKRLNAELVIYLKTKII